MSELKTYVPKALRLAPKEAYLRGLQFRTTKRVVPSGGQNGYNSSNNQIEFIFTDAEGVSLQDSCVRFRVNSYTSSARTTADTSAAVANAGDFVNRIEFYIGQTSVLSTTVNRLRPLVNAMLKNELSDDGWFKYSGRNFVGWSSNGINEGTNVAPASHSKVNGRYFMIPLWVLHPALQAEHLPVLGEQLRVVLTLAPEADCLSYRAGAGSVYDLNDVELQVEHLTYEPEYKRSLMSQIASAEGFSIPMIDFDIQAQQINGSTDIAFTMRNQRSNALSLVIYNPKKASRRVDTVQATYPARSDPTLNIDIGGKTSVLKCWSGDRNFTPLNGYDTPVGLMGSLERCAGGFAKESGGAVQWDEYTATVHDFSNNLIPFSPVMVSLERTNVPDTEMTVVNRGLSAYDNMVNADIDVQMTLSEALNASNEELYSAIVYEKSLVMANGQISVDA